METLSPTHEDILKAAELIKCGKIVAFPTETVYGIGASIYNINAIGTIYKIKSREFQKPLAAHISDINMVPMVSSIVPDLFYDLAQIFLPGPLTIIIPAASTLPSIVTSNTNSIAIRFPDNAVCRKLIDAVGLPLAATSANVSGQEAATSISGLPPEIQNNIEAAIDGGVSLLKVASTVISLMQSPTLIREGAIKAAHIEGKLGRKLFSKNDI